DANWISGSRLAKAALLQQPLNRQPGKQTRAHATHPAGIGLGAVAVQVPIVPPSPPDLAIAIKINAVGVTGDVLIEGPVHRLCKRRAIDQKAHLRVQVGRAWIKVERADKKRLAVNGKGFG